MKGFIIGLIMFGVGLTLLTSPSDSLIPPFIGAVLMGAWYAYMFGGRKGRNL